MEIIKKVYEFIKKYLVWILMGIIAILFFTNMNSCNRINTDMANYEKDKAVWQTEMKGYFEKLKTQAKVQDSLIRLSEKYKEDIANKDKEIENIKAKYNIEKNKVKEFNASQSIEFLKVKLGATTDTTVFPKLILLNRDTCGVIGQKQITSINTVFIVSDELTEENIGLYQAIDLRDKRIIVLEELDKSRVEMIKTQNEVITSQNVIIMKQDKLIEKFDRKIKRRNNWIAGLSAISGFFAVWAITK